MMLAGCGVIVGGAALFLSLVDRNSELARSMLLAFFLGFVLLLEGCVELVSGLRWLDHPGGRRMLFIVLGTPAAVAAALGVLLLVENLTSHG